MKNPLGINPKDPLEVNTVRRNQRLPKWIQFGKSGLYKRMTKAGHYPSSTWYSANGLTFYNIYDLQAMARAGQKRKEAK